MISEQWGNRMSLPNRRQISISCKRIYNDVFSSTSKFAIFFPFEQASGHVHWQCGIGKQREKFRQEEPAIRQAEADNAELERQLREKRKVADSLQAQLNELKENRQGLKDTLVWLNRIIQLLGSYTYSSYLLAKHTVRTHDHQQRYPEISNIGTI